MNVRVIRRAQCNDESGGFRCQEPATRTLVLRPMTYGGEGRIEYRRCARHAFRYAASTAGRVLCAFVQ
jgi:hypothetical protein